MKVIVFQDEAYQALLKEFEKMISRVVSKSKTSKQEKVWINEEEAKELLGVKSKAKMQQLRDDRLILFSHHGRIIRYNRKNIIEFINQHIPNH
jgi:hypothetical protein